jgi:hypothetical protein
LLANHLKEGGLVEDVKGCMDSSEWTNVSAGSPEMIKAALLAGMYPNILRVQHGEVFRGRIGMNARGFVSLEGSKATLQRESINSRVARLDADWLMYLNCIQLEEQGEDMVRDSSIVSSMTLLLMAGKTLEISEVGSFEQTLLAPEELEDPVILRLDNSELMQFVCSRRVGEVLVAFRECLKELTDWHILNWKRLSYEPELQRSKQHRLYQKVVQLLPGILTHAATQYSGWIHDDDVIQRFVPSRFQGRDKGEEDSSR